jgi:hypothetical protein
VLATCFSAMVTSMLMCMALSNWRSCCIGALAVVALAALAVVALAALAVVTLAALPGKHGGNACSCVLCSCPAYAAFARSAYVTENVDGNLDSTYLACAHGCEVYTITNEHASYTDEQNLRGMAVKMVITTIIQLHCLVQYNKIRAQLSYAITLQSSLSISDRLSHICGRYICLK